MIASYLSCHDWLGAAMAVVASGMAPVASFIRCISSATPPPG